jgi:tetratricopeptide (TPR) repeat protein
MRLLPILLLVVVGGMTAKAEESADFVVGDLVVAVGDVDLRVKKDGRVQVTDRVFPGVTMRVKLVSGRWLWVSNGIPGWINKRDVISLDRAIDFFTHKIDENPRISKWRYARAVAWTNKGELDIAIADYTELIRLRQSPPFYHVRGICHHSKGDYDKAVSDFNEAIRLDPTSARYYNSRAETRIEQRDLDRAISDCEQAIRLEPHLASAFTNRGRAYSAKGDIGLAIGDFEKAMSLDPNYELAYTHFAWLLATADEARHRDGERAVKFAERACELTNWEDPYCLGTLGAAYAEVGDFDAALKWETKAQELYPAPIRQKWAFLIDLYKDRKPFRQSMGGA